MSLPHALLTALIEKPGSGLALSKRFDRSIGFYWQATHQQIYRELARMQAQGWVESTVDAGSRGRKKEYRVVAAGRKELRRWAAQHCAADAVRSELMVRMLAEATLSTRHLAADIAHRLTEHEARLATLKSLDAQHFAAPDTSRAVAITRLILKKGIMNEMTWIDWSRQAIEVLRQEDPAA